MTPHVCFAETQKHFISVSINHSNAEAVLLAFSVPVGVPEFAISVPKLPLFSYPSFRLYIVIMLANTREMRVFTRLVIMLLYAF